MPGQVTYLGCKVNQAESAWLQAQLQHQGLVDVAVLFTCAVTANASRQSRQMARRLRKNHAQLIVTGCDVQLAPETYHALGARVLPRASLSCLASTGPWPIWQPGAPMPAPHSGPWVNGWREPGPLHTRAQLKVQDGCDANCAYCIVPTTRGLPRSLPLFQAVKSFVKLGNSGANEVVLSGIHLGRYQDENQDLSQLLPALLAAHPTPRIRLSSLEANELSPELLRLMASQPRLCPHLHLPLQAGSDDLLKAMGRTYTTGQYISQVERAAAAIPGVCLGADVLVGLPGEDDIAHNQLITLLQALPIAYLHVFPYSPRPGTPAAAMPGRPDSQTTRGRAAALRALGRAKWLNFLKTQIGNKLWVLVENKQRGRAENYCQVKISDPVKPGTMAWVEIKSLAVEQDYALDGDLIP